MLELLQHKLMLPYLMHPAHCLQASRPAMGLKLCCKTAIRSSRVLAWLGACCMCFSLAWDIMQGLEEAVGVSVVHPTWQKTKPDDPSDEHCGWTFAAPDDPPFQSPSGERCLACSTAARGALLASLLMPSVCSGAAFVKLTSDYVEYLPSKACMIDGGLDGMQVL